MAWSSTSSRAPSNLLLPCNYLTSRCYNDVCLHCADLGEGALISQRIKNGSTFERGHIYELWIRTFNSSMGSNLFSLELSRSVSRNLQRCTISLSCRSFNSQITTKNNIPDFRPSSQSLIRIELQACQAEAILSTGRNDKAGKRVYHR